MGDVSAARAAWYRAVTLAFTALSLALLILQFYAPDAAKPRDVILTVDTWGARSATVKRVSPYTQTDLRAGDSVLLDRMSPVDRVRLWQGGHAGERLFLPIVREGRERTATLVSTSTRRVSQSAYAVLIAGLGALFIFAVVAWKKPSIATLGLLYFASNAILIGQAPRIFAALPGPAYLWLSRGINAAFGILPVYGLVLFLARYPRPSPAKVASGNVLVAIAIAAEMCFTVITIAPAYAIPGLREGVVYVSTLAVIVYALWAYLPASGEERRRMGWIVAAILVGDVFNAVFAILNGAGPPALMAFLQLGSLVVPVAFAYAILRHRVLDLSFAFNRAVVYGSLTTFVLVAISLTDWLVGRVLSGSSMAVFVEGAVTVGIGIGMSAAHARIERALDRIVFRTRYVRARRVESRIAAMRVSAGETTILTTLAVDAAELFDLRWAAVYQPGGDAFVLAAASGTVPVGERYDGESLLVRTLRGERRPIVPHDLAIPVNDGGGGLFAVPLCAADGELQGFALYGLQRNGTLPDPEEIALLGRLAAGAAGALETLELRRLRERNVELESALRAQGGWRAHPSTSSG